MSSYPKKVICPTCGGKGVLPLAGTAPCQNCQEKGWIGPFDQPVMCPVCQGRKRVDVDIKCSHCDGLGGRVVLSDREEIDFTGRDPVTGKTADQLKKEAAERSQKAQEKADAAAARRRQLPGCISAVLVVGGLILLIFLMIKGLLSFGEAILFFVVLCIIAAIQEKALKLK